MKIKFYIITVCSFVLLLGQSDSYSQEGKEIRYVPIGDSYTIGTGATPEQSWPAVLTAHFKREGIPIVLIENPARAGWTTQDAIDKELPVFKRSKPNFASLMIGVNDWVQGVSAQTFRANFAFLLDAMLKELDNSKRMFVVTIPDFSLTPKGIMFAQGRDISKGIAGFNKIINEEAKKRNILIVDIFYVSRQMAGNPIMLSGDGLHPSANGYGLWEMVIYQGASSLLTGENLKRKE